jgi:two-component system, OmpR family, sensor histidine kinase CiaH
MKLHEGATKLAALYLLVMMTISFFFSLNVYQLSVQEFDRGFRRPAAGTISVGSPQGGGPETRIFSTQADVLIENREELFQEARNRILNRLVMINVGILIGGGILSYYLALRTLKPIEEAHVALERFTADASHELRTPITAMRSENEVALMNPRLTLAQAKLQIKSNIEELEKLTELSEGLLRLASLDNNDLAKDVLKPESMVNKAISRVVAQAEKKNILINRKINTDIDIIGDEGSIVEAIVILLDNAVKYSNERTEINVEVDKTHSGVTIKVSDNGMGIKATELPHIFDRFYRADTARSKQRVDGYGLGLAIAKNIATLHQGSLTAVSKPGKGSTFTLTIPAKG